MKTPKMKTMEGSAVEGGAVVGIDVSKASLDVSVSAGPARRFANTEEGIADLLQLLEAQEVAQVVCEPTGGYELQLVNRLRAGGLGVHQAHPNQVRDFARAAGHLAKTDALDAQTLSRYGQVFEPPDTPQPDPEREELRDLLRRRQQLVEQRVQELNRRHQGTSRKARASTARHIAWLDQEIAQLDEEYQAALQSSESLAQRAALYRSVPGVGPLTAATLTAELPELGQYDGKALTSLVGLAPWSRDSGRKRGQRTIRGGRGVVRRALYMAALAATRGQGSLPDFYRQLRQRGKTGKVALVAVMRKLLLQLNAVARRGTPWVQQHG